MTNINDNGQFVQSDEVVACDFEGGQALLDLNEGEYYRLNSSAAIIWGAMVEPISINGLVEIFTERFDVTAKQCHKDIESVVDDLTKSNLIRQVDAKDC